MERELLFRLYHKQLKEMFWFDLRWGTKQSLGGGWLSVLRISEDRGYGHDDKRILIDPMECEITQLSFEIPMKKLLILLLFAAAFTLPGKQADATNRRCPEAGTRYCDDYWVTIGTGPGGTIIQQRNCTLIVAIGENCFPVADPEFREIAP